MASDATAVFGYRYNDTEPFTAIGEQFIARRGRWVGAKTGIFAVTSPLDTEPELPNEHPAGFVDVDYVNFIPMNRE